MYINTKKSSKGRSLKLISIILFFLFTSVSIYAQKSSYNNALGKPCAGDREFIRSLFQSILERDVNPTKIPYRKGSHLYLLKNGVSRKVVIQHFLNSPEYMKKSKSIREFVRDAYQSVLGREPSSYELNIAVNSIKNQFVSNLFNSNEYKKIIAGCLASKTSDISGYWKWFTGDIIIIYKDHRVVPANGNGYSGLWKVKRIGNKFAYIINWGNGTYIDTLYLTGNTLNGSNQNGTHVWGKKISNLVNSKLRNGSFEYVSQNIGRFKVFNKGSIDINGWLVTKGSVDVVGSYWRSIHGTKSVDICGSSPGAISQSIVTQPGRTYTLSFYLAGNYVHSGIKILQVKAGNILKTYYFDTRGKNSNNMGWVKKSFKFTATSNITNISFIAPDNNDRTCGPVIDNVTIN